MKLRWDVDDSTVVEAEIGPWGKHDIAINGRNVDNTLNARKKNEAARRGPASTGHAAGSAELPNG